MNNRPQQVAAIKATGLRRCFHDGEREIEVIRGLDLEVAGGESVAVVGASGVGKSTLLNILGTLDKPDQGEVLLGGRNMFAMAPVELAAARNRLIGFVFQFHYLLGDFDAEENVMMPLLVGGMAPREARRRARRILDQVGLSDRRSHRPGELSGGEQQRVAVARAVVTEPEVILADEPTGNLDPGTAGEVHDLLREVQNESGCALLVATHNPALASILDRTLLLSPEGLLEVGSK